MFRRKRWIALVGALVMVMVAGCSSSSTKSQGSSGELTEVRQGSFATIVAAPDNPDNPSTPEKVELGKMLFFDPRLSSSGVISCATCHNLGLGGTDRLPVSFGHGFAQTPRNAPTVLNAAFFQNQFWDGRAQGLEEQAKGPIQAKPR